MLMTPLVLNHNKRQVLFSEQTRHLVSGRFEGARTILRPSSTDSGTFAT